MLQNDSHRGAFFIKRDIWRAEGLTMASLSDTEQHRRLFRGLAGGAARVWALNIGTAVAAVALYIMVVQELPPRAPSFTLSLWAMAILFYVSEISVVHLQFKRDAYSFSLSEIPLVIGFFFSTPVDLVLGQFVGALLALALHRRQSPLKVAFNVSHYCFEACLASIIFFSLAPNGDALDPFGWLVTFGAAYAGSFVSMLMVVAAISLSEGRLRLETVGQSMAYGSIVTVTNASLALLGVAVMATKPEAAALMLVPSGLLFLSYRAYVTQRERRESVEFLYESSRLAHRSLEVESAVLALLRQAREMFRAEVAQVTLFSDEEENVGYRSSLGPGEKTQIMEKVDLNPKEGVWARVAAEGQSVLVARPIQNERLKLHFASRGIFKDAMVAPLFGESGVAGTVLVGDRLGDVSTFDGEDLKLFETLSNHASVSLENARLVDRLKQSLSHLTEMNRLKDDFVAAVSHELRTPLTSIQGYVKTLLRPGASFEAEVQQSFLEAVDRQSDRLRNLIEDLLVVSQLEAQSVSTSVMPVKLASVIENVTNELREKLEGRNLSVDVPADTPVVFSDEGKIFQILSNFVDNAAKYSPPGTSISVQARLESDGVTVSVRDSGDGIPEDEQERIFERFYQVDQSSTRKVGGTGLGLYICRRLAEALHGRVWLERSNPEGSTFALWVPLSSPSLDQVATPSLTGVPQTLD